MTSFITLAAATPASASDKQLLLSIVPVLTGPGYTGSCFDTWTDVNQPCLSGFIGVQCDGDGKIISLNRAECNLRGSLPANCSQLSSLQQILFPRNYLAGSLPVEWGNLTSLFLLDFHNNQLSGVLPAAWSNMTALRSLNVRSNKLEGPLPAEWSSLRLLKTLVLSLNYNLNGSLPPAWSNMTSLQVLDLGRNALTGTLPVEWVEGGMSSSLLQLMLHQNQLSGSLPPEWGGFTALQELFLSLNQLSGELPAEWANLKNLTTLALAGNNQIAGLLPSSWGIELTAMRSLDLGGMQLSGPIPDDWAAGSKWNLDTIVLQSNKLNETLPLHWGNAMFSLATMRLTDNLFTGPLPLEWSVMPLTNLQLDFNELNGTIPPSWNNLTRLRFFHGSANKLTGELPSGFDAMMELITLWLHSNQFAGTVPGTWSRLSKLSDLRLNNNQLTGPLPKGFSNLTSLIFLFLENNEFYCPLPPLPEWSPLVSKLGSSNLYIFPQRLRRTVVTLNNNKYHNNSSNYTQQVFVELASSCPNVTEALLSVCVVGDSNLTRRVDVLENGSAIVVQDGVARDELIDNNTQVIEWAAARLSVSTELCYICNETPPSTVSITSTIVASLTTTDPAAVNNSNTTQRLRIPLASGVFAGANFLLLAAAAAVPPLSTLMQSLAAASNMGCASVDVKASEFSRVLVPFSVPTDSPLSGLLGISLLFGGFMLLHLLALFIAWCMYGRDYELAAWKVHFPTLSITAMLLASCGLSYQAGILIAYNGATAAEIVLGVVAIGVVVVFLVALHFWALRAVERIEDKRCDTLFEEREVLWLVSIYPGKPRKYLTQGLYVGPYSKRWWGAFDVCNPPFIRSLNLLHPVFGAVTCFLAGCSFASSTACVGIAYFLFVLFLAFAVVVVAFRPHRRPINLPASVFLSLLSAFICLCNAGAITPDMELMLTGVALVWIFAITTFIMFVLEYTTWWKYFVAIRDESRPVNPLHKNAWARANDDDSSRTPHRTTASCGGSSELEPSAQSQNDVLRMQDVEMQDVAESAHQNNHNNRDSNNSDCHAAIDMTAAFVVASPAENNEHDQQQHPSGPVRSIVLQDDDDELLVEEFDDVLPSALVIILLEQHSARSIEITNEHEQWMSSLAAESKRDRQIAVNNIKQRFLHEQQELQQHYHMQRFGTTGEWLTAFLGIVRAAHLSERTQLLAVHFLSVPRIRLNSEEQLARAVIVREHNDFFLVESQRVAVEMNSVLGRGGFGIVYAGTLDSSTPIAVKILSATNSDSSTRALLLREALHLSSLQHPHVVHCFGVSINNRDNSLMLLAERCLCSVSDLQRRLPSSKFSIAATFAIMRDICSGVKYLHSSGIVHRDLKPSNFLIAQARDGTIVAKVNDFGSVKKIPHTAESGTQAATTASTLTGTSGLKLGPAGATASFLGPECVQPQTRATPAADVFSLGATIFVMMSGEHLPRYTKSDAEEYTSWPEEVRQLVMSCLEREPMRRPSMDELVDRVARIGRQYPLSAEESARLRRLAQGQTQPANTTVVAHTLPARVGDMTSNRTPSFMPAAVTEGESGNLSAVNTESRPFEA